MALSKKVLDAILATGAPKVVWTVGYTGGNEVPRAQKVERSVMGRVLVASPGHWALNNHELYDTKRDALRACIQRVKERQKDSRQSSSSVRLTYNNAVKHARKNLDFELRYCRAATDRAAKHLKKLQKRLRDEK